MIFCENAGPCPIAIGKPHPREKTLDEILKTRSSDYMTTETKIGNYNSLRIASLKKSDLPVRYYIDIPRGRVVMTVWETGESPNPLTSKVIQTLRFLK